MFFRSHFGSSSHRASGHVGSSTHRASGHFVMPARRLPFYAFVAYESDGSYVVVALCLVSGIWIAGTSKQERRQFAVKSWLTAASDICTLDLDLPRAATVDFKFAKSDFRYINTIGELKPAAFHACLGAACFEDAVPLGMRPRPCDIPVLFAFSQCVGDSIARGGFSTLVLVPNAVRDLQLPFPDQVHTDPMQWRTKLTIHKRRAA